MNKMRGRPKLYDAEKALEAAGNAFWVRGFSNTSLDDLAAAMGMNRPSIYRAFGDKKAIYRKALTRFGEKMEDSFRRNLIDETDFRIGLRNFYGEALKIYSAGDTPRGCMVMCTAPAAALSHPEVKSDLLNVLRQIDTVFQARIEQAIKQGQLPSAMDAKTLSQLLQAVQLSLAIRARAGESAVSLQAFADNAVSMLFGKTGITYK